VKLHLLSLIGIHPDGKSSGITNSVCGSPASAYSGESDIGRGCLGSVGENLGRCQTGKRGVELELAKRAGSTGVDDSFGYTLMVKVRDLLAVVEVYISARV
jgi:hypothetical protein